MSEENEVVTPIAYIMGQVMVSGMKGRGVVAEVRVAAQSDSHTTEVRAKNESTYVLLVSPGEWVVTAEVGGVSSEPTQVHVESGQTLELNFLFGKRS